LCRYLFFGVVFVGILRFEVSLRRVEGLFSGTGLAQVLFSVAKARGAVCRVEFAARMGRLGVSAA
jgi:hypothetical protein